MPTAYDGRADTAGDERSYVIDKDFFKTIRGILKLVQLGVSMVTFICASVSQQFASVGGGWVMFFTGFVFAITVIIILMYLFAVMRTLSKPSFMAEMIIYITITLVLFPCGVVAAINGGVHGSVGAAAFFCFLTMIAYGVDAFFQVRALIKGEVLEGQGDTPPATSAAPSTSPTI